MRLCTFEYEGRQRAGVVRDNKVIDAGANLTRAVWSGIDSITRLGAANSADYGAAAGAGVDADSGATRGEAHGGAHDAAGGAIRAAARGAGGTGAATTALPLDTVRLWAPFRPRRIIAVGLNYRRHAEEIALTPAGVPTIFPKFSESVIGPGDAIVLPRVAREYDYEAELACVIGRPGRHIAVDQAMQHVAGYTCLNDVSARDYQFATSQWMAGKVFDTFCPLGPWLVTADEVSDPHRLAVRLWIDGVLMQDGNTADLIFRIPDLIAYLSKVFTLLPGDVIATGTPPGAGMGRTPRRWLRAGESVRVEVQDVGVLENPCVAEEPEPSTPAGDG